MLGEHDWWGKNAPPFWDETIHTPLFIWDPRSRIAGERRQSLVQTIDFGPTLLEFFGIDRTPDMRGVPLREVVARDTPVREAGLFGCFGGHAAPLPFTKGVATLRLPGFAYTDPHTFGTLLYDLENDPEQLSPLIDDDLELRMATLMVDLMRADHAPPEQYERLGLPPTGPVTTSHLLIREQWDQVQASDFPPLTAAEFPASRLSVETPTRLLLAEPAAEAVLRKHLGALMDSPLLPEAMPFSLLEIAEMAVGVIGRETLHAVADDLKDL